MTRFYVAVGLVFCVLVGFGLGYLTGHRQEHRAVVVEPKVASVTRAQHVHERVLRMERIVERVDTTDVLLGIEYAYVPGQDLLRFYNPFEKPTPSKWCALVPDAVTVANFNLNITEAICP